MKKENAISVEAIEHINITVPVPGLVAQVCLGLKPTSNIMPNTVPVDQQ